jgi:hypothetical protein
MAPRKDMMRIIRQDTGFSAKLGFGGMVAGSPVLAELEPTRPLPMPGNGETTRDAKAMALASARGQVVYVAVSLTARQATLAEDWATAARCSVQFLIRRVAQGLRDTLFDDWERDGMPHVAETRGARGRHPTSVTLTLRPAFAASLSAQHDPLGILGLARVMGPAFRARFEIAFDQALSNSGHQARTEGDDS